MEPPPPRLPAWAWSEEPSTERLREHPSLIHDLSERTRGRYEESQEWLQTATTVALATELYECFGDDGVEILESEHLALLVITIAHSTRIPIISGEFVTAMLYAPALVRRATLIFFEHLRGSWWACENPSFDAVIDHLCELTHRIHRACISPVVATIDERPICSVRTPERKLVSPQQPYAGSPASQSMQPVHGACTFRRDGL